ncbi:hypothetical protein KZX39_12035, partial [Micrococcus endophyticus]|nr:hypothetical protein [Micrococcus endophyticus]
MNRPPEHDWDDLPGDEADPDDDLDVFGFVHEDADDDPDEARRLGAPAAAAGGRRRGLLRRRGTGSHPAAP